MKTEENGIWSDFALEGLEGLDKEKKRDIKK